MGMKTGYLRSDMHRNRYDINAEIRGELEDIEYQIKWSPVV
jgi:hypothetical protein